MNVYALKELYKALGGDLTDTYASIANGAAVGDYSTIADCILAIAKVAASAGIELPAVSGSDNGNVLTVVEGKWAKAAVPTELPAVSAEDNGDVLKVVDGVWAKGTDEIQA